MVGWVHNPHTAWRKRWTDTRASLEAHKLSELPGVQRGKQQRDPASKWKVIADTKLSLTSICMS